MILKNTVYSQYQHLTVRQYPFPLEHPPVPRLLHSVQQLGHVSQRWEKINAGSDMQRPQMLPMGLFDVMP